MISISCGLLCAGGGQLLGQDYRMDWQAVHSGAGVSAGGSYVLAGSVGQVESGSAMVGGEYLWWGGFWSAWAGSGEVQEAPRLVISWNGDQLTLSWDGGGGNYTLEETGDLESPVWVESGLENGVATAPAAGRAVYYRLVGQ
ncbi:MAG: hypothetical protein ACO34E_09945 [Limisphaerales bacterium]